MTEHVSRRRLMQLGIGAVASAGLTASSAPLTHAETTTQNPAAVPGGFRPASISASIDKAYKFLDFMMDAYATGSTPRVVQSYSDEGGLAATAFIYDNALIVQAYLAQKNLTRAKVVGDAILYAQSSDPAGDGRVRQAYFANAPAANGDYVTPGYSYFQGSAMGDVAWTGMALAQLFDLTGEQKYLNGAIAAGTFIEGYRDTNPTPGGFFFGNGAQYKSVEHNIDIYAFFSMLARLTRNASWTNGANFAKAFVEALYFPAGGHFWTGTSDAANDINYSNTPEDVQTWSYLAFKDPNYSGTLDWVKTNLATTDTSFAFNNTWGLAPGGLGYGTLNVRVSGMTYASLSKLGVVVDGSLTGPSDADAVWLEGTSHLIAALLQRGLPASKDIPGFNGDVDTALQLIASCQIAQNNLAGLGGTPVQHIGGTPIPAGQGLVAATSALNTGFGFSYYPNLHIGATAWYVMGAQGYNPMRLQRW
jgi:hypothetical protein